MMIIDDASSSHHHDGDDGDDGDDDDGNNCVDDGYDGEAKTTVMSSNLLSKLGPMPSSGRRT